MWFTWAWALFYSMEKCFKVYSCLILKKICLCIYLKNFFFYHFGYFTYFVSYFFLYHILCNFVFYYSLFLALSYHYEADWTALVYKMCCIKRLALPNYHEKFITQDGANDSCIWKVRRHWPSPDPCSLLSTLRFEEPLAKILTACRRSVLGQQDSPPHSKESQPRIAQNAPVPQVVLIPPPCTLVLSAAQKRQLQQQVQQVRCNHSVIQQSPRIQNGLL